MNIKKCEPVDKKDFAKRLKQAREDASLSQKDFAFLSGYKERQYRKFESPESENLPSLESFFCMVQLAQTSPGYLLNGIGPRFMDKESSLQFKEALNRAFDLERPNYGILMQEAVKLNDKQIDLLIDMIPIIADYDTTFKKRVRKRLDK